MSLCWGNTLAEQRITAATEAEREVMQANDQRDQEHSLADWTLYDYIIAIAIGAVGWFAIIGLVALIRA